MTAYADAERLADERDRGDRWRYRARKAEAERDALRARIEAAPHAPSCLVPGFPGARCSCWKSAALAGDRPEATPEPVSLSVADQTLIVRQIDEAFDDQGGSSRHWVQALNEAGYRIAPLASPVAKSAGDSTPEPPHLDPEPYTCVCMVGSRWNRWDVERSHEAPGHFTLSPRAADENGKPYSQDRAHYGVQS